MDVVEGGQQALICTHDNPDPDSIASAFALGRLLEARCKVPFKLAYGGVLGRAENKAMVKLLRIPLVHVSRVDWACYDVVGLVDTQVEAGNHSLPRELLDDKRVVCIDHHPAREATHETAYADVGGDAGATSTVLASYLHAAGVEPDQSLATALFYGIKSDTRDLGREASDEDVWAYSHLVSRTDMALLSAIEHPRLPRAYYHVLMRAIQSAEVYDNVVLCDLGELYIPDLVAETADRLAASEGMRWGVIVGEYEGSVFVSLRVNDRRYSAGKLIREVVETHYPEGSAGGHGSMAGAKIPHHARTVSPAARKRARRKLLKRLAHAIGVDETTTPKEAFASLAIEEAQAERVRAKLARHAKSKNGSTPPKKVDAKEEREVVKATKGAR
jgi:nanoRNase/pAp phosphatase (c-di-AMP/oligoRNAs hydrolase)